MHNPHFTYRADIDGLRAIAVAAVVTFHAFPEVMPGGFVGVDIFFVISGFLITHILRREIAAATFSIRVFYLRRVRRLFPALTLVLGATLAIGWGMLLENEFRQLGKHAAAGAGFVANIVLWQESGYFETSSELKPLLHLWSLGIEEQFYILWPLLIAVTYRFRLGFLALACLLGLVSFAVNLMLVEAKPNAAFFLPHPRFWELILGGLLASAQLRPRICPVVNSTLTLRWVSQIAAFIGLVLIAVALALTDKNLGFPGWWATLPTFGAVLLLGAGPQTWVTRRLLSIRPLVALGLISYPLYLWHWPLLTFARLLYPDTPPSEIRMVAVVAALLLAWLTYAYVERPISKAVRDTEHSSGVIHLLVVVMIVIFAAGLIVQSGIATERLYPLRALNDAKRDWSYPHDDAAAAITGVSGQSILLFGDSLVQQYYPRLRYLTERHPERHPNVLFQTWPACAPLPGFNRKFVPECLSHVTRGFARAAAGDIKTIVVGGYWLGMLQRGDYYRADDPDQHVVDLWDPKQLDSALSGMENRLRELKAMGKMVYIVLNPAGGQAANPSAIGFRRIGIDYRLWVKSAPLAAQQERTAFINDRIRGLAERVGVAVMDPLEWLCSGNTCQFTDDAGVPYFKDATHLRASYVRCCITAFDNLLIFSQ